MQHSDDMTIARETKIVEDIVRKWRLPPNVRRFDVEFGEDSTGDPAVWIWLLVDDELSPSSQSISRMERFVTDVRSELLRKGLRHWPYFRLRAAA